jgi:hypothetical protein
MCGFAILAKCRHECRHGRLKPAPRRVAQVVFMILMAVAGRAEVIDRIAITVGPRAITESDILREIRLAAFFNRTEADFSLQAKRQAAGRLVERALIGMEMEAGQYAFPDDSEVAPALAAMKKDQFPIAGAGLSEADVRRSLLEQLALERFIDERFGPAVQVSDDEMREYYRKKGLAPPFEEVRGEIGQILRAQRADELLNNWLKESRGRIRIEFKDEALQ